MYELILSTTTQPQTPECSLPVPKHLPRRDMEGSVLPNLQDAAVGFIIAKGNIGEVLSVGSNSVQQVHFICIGEKKEMLSR